MSLGTEDVIFFVFDNNKVQDEQDFVDDGILYFSPLTVDESEKSGLVGQLIGISRFLQVTFGSPASVYRLHDRKIAFRHVEHYTLGLSGTVHSSNSHLLSLLNQLWTLFQFYQGGFSILEEVCSRNGKDFRAELQKSWDCFLALIKRYGDEVSSQFQSVPSLRVSKDIALEVYLKSSQLLEEVCRSVAGVKSGCLLYNNRVCCSQMKPDITSRFLLIRPKQQNHPCQQLATDLELQGIRTFKVYLTQDELSSLGSSGKVRTCSAHRSTSKKGHRELNVDVNGDIIKPRLSTSTKRHQKSNERSFNESRGNEKAEKHSGESDSSKTDGNDIEEAQLVNGVKKPHLVEMEMFVQGSSDSVCILLMECGSLSDIDILKKNWKRILLHFAEIEQLIHRSVNDVDSIKKMNDCYFVYNNALGTLSGNCLNPVTAPENEFCETAKVIHDQFLVSTDIKEMSLRNHQRLFYGIEDGYNEFFFWPASCTSSPGLQAASSEQDLDKIIRIVRDAESNFL